MYVLVALIVTKRATVHIGLCGAHRRRRRRNILISLLACLVVPAIFVTAAVAGDNAAWLILAAACLLGGLVFAAVAIAPVRPARIDGRYVWLRGCCAEYLAALPPWPEQH